MVSKNTARNYIASGMTWGNEAKGKTTEEVLKNAGLDFEVGLEPIYTSTGRPIRSKFHRTFRTDTDFTLGVVTNKYHVMQNQHMLQIADGLIDTGEIEWDRIGMVENGVSVMASFKLPETHTIGDWGDAMEQRIYLMQSHDGSGGLKVIPSMMRLVCTNQASAFAAQLTQANIDLRSLTIRHSSKMTERIGMLKNALRIQNQFANQFVHDAEQMLKVEMTQDDRIEFYIDTLNLTRVENADAVDNDFGLKTRGMNTLNHLLALENAPTNTVGDMFGTGWQAYNVLTEYIDHAWIHNADGSINQGKAERALVGTGARIKNKAYNGIMQLTV